MDDQISQKFKNCVIKIARVNSILITKSINLLLFNYILYCVGVKAFYSSSPGCLRMESWRIVC